MTSRVQLLTKNLKKPTLELQNGFASVEDEQPEELLRNPATDVVPAEQPKTTTSLDTETAKKTDGPLDPALHSPTRPEFETAQNLHVKEVIGRKAQISNVTLDTDIIEHVLLRIEGKINFRNAWLIIDSGSTHDFISLDFAQKKKLEIESLESSR